MKLFGRFLRETSGGGYTFWCPACQWYHHIPNGWAFNGDSENPTFDPSLNHSQPEKNWCCHYVIINGVIHYTPDSTHKFKGQAVPMVELTEHLGWADPTDIQTY